MLTKIEDSAYQQMYCIDCFEISGIQSGAEVICEHCRSPRLSVENILPCGCEEGGELITNDDTVVHF